MNKNPFSNQRYEIARKNVINLKKILKSGDLDGFISITESEALMIHSLIERLLISFSFLFLLGIIIHPPILIQTQ